MISAHWVQSLLPGGMGGILGGGRVGSELSCLCLSGWGAPVPLGLKRDCGCFAVPLWQGMHLSGSFWQSIAWCLSIAAFTFVCPGNSTPRLISSWTSARGVLIRYRVFLIAGCEYPPGAILAIFKARHMSDCSSCTRPPYLAMVADMLKTYKKLVAASNNKIRLVPQPYTLPKPPLRWIKPISSTPGDAQHEIRPRKSHSWEHHHVRIHGLCRQMHWSTMEASHYGQGSIDHIAVNEHQLYIIHLVEGRLPRYGYTHICLHAASYSWCFWSYGQFLNVHPGSYSRWLHWQRRSGLTGDCILVVCQWLTDWMKRPLIGSIRTRCYQAVVFVYPRFGGVE